MKRSLELGVLTWPSPGLQLVAIPVLKTISSNSELSFASISTRLATSCTVAQHLVKRRPAVASATIKVVIGKPTAARASYSKAPSATQL